MKGPTKHVQLLQTYSGSKWWRVLQKQGFCSLGDPPCRPTSFLTCTSCHSINIASMDQIYTNLGLVDSHGGCDIDNSFGERRVYVGTKKQS